MKELLSISLPTKDVEKIKKIAKKRGFLSVSSYVKHLLQEDDVISEKELLSMAKKARAEYRKGTIRRAKSIADLV